MLQNPTYACARIFSWIDDRHRRPLCMRFLVLSDLHVEFAQFAPQTGLEYDAVFLAGDVYAPGHKVFAWARRPAVFGPVVPIVYAPGNHEFYRSVWQSELSAMRDAASNFGVHLLDHDEVILTDPAEPDGPGIRVLGATLWTDFALPVSCADGTRQTDVARALGEANKRLNDFRLIDLEYKSVADTGSAAARERSRRRPLRAEDTLSMHYVARDWLRRRLAEPFPGRTVVVTHHAPSVLSLDPQFSDDWLSPAFVSDLPSEFFEVPKLWVHGHTHTTFDHHVGACRVVCNPRGYKLRSKGFENADFDPAFVVEV